MFLPGGKPPLDEPRLARITDDLRAMKCKNMKNVYYVKTKEICDAFLLIHTFPMDVYIYF
jgi:hypothetical protein